MLVWFLAAGEERRRGQAWLKEDGEKGERDGDGLGLDC